MAEDKTCKFFAPDRTAAATYHLLPNPRWRYDRLFADARCTNPAMGAGDMPVPCPYQNEQPTCKCYAEEPAKILAVWRHPKPALAFGEHLYEFLLVSETRVGPGMRVISVQRFPSNDEEGTELGESMPLESFTSYTHGAEAVETVAITYVTEYRAAAGDDWERVPHLEGREDRPSYFGHVLALATATE